MAFETNVDDRLRLDLPSLETTDDYLEITYSLTNDSSAIVFVANGLFHRRGGAGFEVNPNLVYSELIDDSTLRISKQMVEIPEGVSVEAPEVPYFTRLESGAELSERIRLAFPISPRNPYRRQPPGDDTREIERLIFAVGYVPSDETLKPKEMTLSDGSRYLWMSYSDVIRRQQLKEYGPVETRTVVASSSAT